MRGLLTRTPHRLKPDASRTICRLFVPGQETLIRGESRAMAVIERILDLSDDEVEGTLDAGPICRWVQRPSGDTENNFKLVAHRLGGEIRVGSARRQLIGAYFAREYPPPPEPLLVADESERVGYVPNVVYSSGRLDERL